MFLPSTITLKFGDSGDFVTELQNRLVQVKALSDGMVTGFYDGSTVNGVMSFQGREGLHADGIAGPETLRRLNGVVSGSSGGAPTDSQQDDQKIEAAQPIQQFVWGETPPTFNPLIEAATPAPVETIASLAPAELTPQPAAQQPTAPDRLQDLGLSAPVNLQAAPTLSARELAGQSILNSQATPGSATPPLDPSAPTLAGQQAQPLAGGIASTTAEQSAAQPQGIVAKTVQFANAVIQKLSDYFEKKLPAPVLAEVQAIGKEMHSSGMKEAPIPTGPDQQRAPALPAKTQEPAQAPQRG